jgi:F-type H+-transporting ATPase subunit delta
MEEIARVYARSLFEVAKDQGKLDVVREQLGAFSDALADNHELSVFFFSPYFSTEEKKAGLHKAVTDADPLVMNVLELLVENHRMPVIHRLRKEFDRLWDEENKLLPVDITSAVDLNEDVVKRLGDQICEQTGRRVQLTTHVDPDVLGGIVLRVGNQILDASIRNRLDQLRRSVAKA